ncbi:hypothetical protein ACTFIT_003565 [Dictyostelium discoideum]
MHKQCILVLIYHSIKNRRIDMLEKIITCEKFTDNHANLIYSVFLKRIINNDDGVDLITFKYLLSHRIIKELGKEFFKNIITRIISVCYQRRLLSSFSLVIINR